MMSHRLLPPRCGQVTGGQIDEFINPKCAPAPRHALAPEGPSLLHARTRFTDASRTAFKSPTRLECMMQAPRRIKGGTRGECARANLARVPSSAGLRQDDTRVPARRLHAVPRRSPSPPPPCAATFTATSGAPGPSLDARHARRCRYPIEFGYYPCKNDIVTAAKLSAAGVPPHSARPSTEIAAHLRSYISHPRTSPPLRRPPRPRWPSTRCTPPACAAWAPPSRCPPAARSAASPSTWARSSR